MRRLRVAPAVGEAQNRPCKAARLRRQAREVEKQMLKHDPWATVVRVEMEERAERAARARLRREARERFASTLETIGQASSPVVRRSFVSSAWFRLRRQSAQRFDLSSWSNVRRSDRLWTKLGSLPAATWEE